MNYYYDVVLNFLEEQIEFYEWENTDAIEYIKKIPLYQVTAETFKDFYTSDVVVSEDFLKDIENKTTKKNGKLKYACILADKNNACAYEFSEGGNVITRSALVLSDELSLLEYIYTIPTKELTYRVNEERKPRKELRISTKIKNVIGMEVDKLYKEKYLDKLEFIYIEWFGKKENNIEKIYKEIKQKLKSDIDKEALRIYELIKLSYNNV